MNNEIYETIIAKCESLPESIVQVIKMLDKNIDEATQYGTPDEVQILEVMIDNLLNKEAGFGEYTSTAIQYLTGRI